MSTCVKTSDPARKNKLMAWPIPQIKLYAVREGGVGAAPLIIHSPGDAARYLRPLSYACEEHFVSLHLNAKLEITGIHEVSHGTLSSSLVHPREVFKAALLANSHAIMLCHNHPSGARLTASREDIETTRQLIQAGKILGVGVLDHLIVGLNNQQDQPEVFSFRENYPKMWSEIDSKDLQV